MSKTSIFKEISEFLMKSSKYSSEILKFLKDFYGKIPKVYEILANNDRDVQVLTQFVKNQSIIKEKKSGLPLKTKELIAIAAAVALGCNYCQEVHMKAALELGVTKDQIIETILISAMMAESSKLAVSMREFEKLK